MLKRTLETIDIILILLARKVKSREAQRYAHVLTADELQSQEENPVPRAPCPLLSSVTEAATYWTFPVC